MNKEQKQEVIEALKDKFSQYSNFYITNTESLSVAQISKLRKHCFDKQVEMKVAKNTLIRKALESLDSDKYSGVYDSLHNVTALMFSDSPKDPAVIISSFRKEMKGERPVLKAAFLNGDIFVGDNQLINLTRIKTKNELIGEVIGLLMSPIQRVIGALQNRPEGELTPAAEAPVAETPAAEAPVAETPAAEAKVETPAAEAKVETPAAEAPIPETPAAEAPVAETPVAEVPATEAPVAEVPAAEAPVAEAPTAPAPAEEAKDEKPAEPTAE